MVSCVEGNSTTTVLFFILILLIIGISNSRTIFFSFIYISSLVYFLQIWYEVITKKIDRTIIQMIAI